jgi:hypothetical protein
MMIVIFAVAAAVCVCAPILGAPWLKRAVTPVVIGYRTGLQVAAARSAAARRRQQIATLKAARHQARCN